jgi:prolyl 4-hydroxylase
VKVRYPETAHWTAIMAKVVRVSAAAVLGVLATVILASTISRVVSTYTTANSSLPSTPLLTSVLQQPTLAIRAALLSLLARVLPENAFRLLPAWLTASRDDPPFQCLPHTYTTELVSLDPPLLYIRHFLTAAETRALLAAGAPFFAPSEVERPRGSASAARPAVRTSQSAALPRTDPAVACVLARARALMGTAFEGGLPGAGPDVAEVDMGPPQLVRYERPGQRFAAHHDWYASPQAIRLASSRDPAGDQARMARGLRAWNRVASFFVVLQDNCTGGATHFPYVTAAAVGAGREGEEEDGGKEWYAHEEGGVAFRPVRGNALFWVNLHANGTGDERTTHAGLPLGEGLKTAMNIWPRQYYTEDMLRRRGYVV